MLTARSQLLGRIHDELAVVRRETTTAAVVARAPGALCSAGGFDRAMISSLRGSTWVPQVLQVVAGVDSPVNTALQELVPGVEIPLSPSMVESELVRRKVPALVQDARSDARLFQPLVELSRTRSYVAAPVIVSGSVLALLHADTYWSGRELRASDRDGIQAFADGLGLILERTILLERLALQQKLVTEALSHARTATDGAGEQPERLSRTSPPPPGGRSTSPPSSRRLSGTQSALAGLTPREQEVLGHLVSGATNAQIADRLSVSETTVKTHVKHILRKLRASNRAEAIARFLQLTRSQGRLQ
jgi:DNA-binding CsgD family transcriptional regulator